MIWHHGIEQSANRGLGLGGDNVTNGFLENKELSKYFLTWVGPSGQTILDFCLSNWHY